MEVEKEAQRFTVIVYFSFVVLKSIRDTIQVDEYINNALMSHFCLFHLSSSNYLGLKMYRWAETAY